MRTSYAVSNDDILVFNSKEARDAFCFRAIFEGGHARRITSKEAYKLYGGVPSFDRCRANITDDPCCNFHVLPIGGVA